jgi:hypothetical protein
VIPLRDDIETTSPDVCPVCGARFHRVRRQLYCSAACKQQAWRRTSRTDPESLPPPRRDHTIYQCRGCDERYLGQQWCPECVRPCRRLGPGGECGCGELLTVAELLLGELP